VGLPIAACATPWFGRVAADAQRHHAVVLDRLRAAGVDVVEITMPPAWTAMEDRHRTICQFEGARNMAHELRVARDRIGPDVLAQWEAGEATPWTAYATALDEARRWRAEWDRLTQSFAAVLTPAARGEAPAGRSDTGDPIMNMAFSFLRVPVLTLPTGHGDGGLPLGTQLAGLRRDDARLLATAAVIAELVGLGE
jgi:amidase